jgi:hypothetical protein
VQFAQQYLSWLKMRDWKAVGDATDPRVLNADSERIFFILVGWGSVQFNWTDAVFTYKVLAIYIPVVRLAQYAFQPFTILMSMPLGTMVFLVWLAGFERRRRAVVTQFE